MHVHVAKPPPLRSEYESILARQPVVKYCSTVVSLFVLNERRRVVADLRRSDERERVLRKDSRSQRDILGRRGVEGLCMH